MTNNQKTTVALIATVVAVAGYFTLSKNVTLDHLNERFPDLNQKIAKRAYRKIMRDALSGKMKFDNWSEEQFNDLFFTEYTMMLAK